MKEYHLQITSEEIVNSSLNTENLFRGKDVFRVKSLGEGSLEG